MKKRLLSLFLAVMLCLSAFPAAGLAAGTGLENFVKAKSYEDGFSDVAVQDWFYENVATAYELGLMVGKGENTFDPNGKVTVAEAITIAARIHSIYYTGTETFEQTEPWYQTYVNYADENGIDTASGADLNAPATRAQFAVILENALPNKALGEINTVDPDSIPDVSEYDSCGEAVYRLYRAGVMVGNDDEGTFAPNATIRRSEVAAIATRMADADLRMAVSLTVKEDFFAPQGSGNGSKIYDDGDDEEEGEPGLTPDPEDADAAVNEELEELKNLNDGALPEILMDTDDYIPAFIAGQYSERKVTDFPSAVASLHDVDDMMKFTDPENEFVPMQTRQVGDTTYYPLQQMYGEYEVFGKQLLVVTDEDGNTTALNGDYDPLAGKVNEQINISEEEAFAIAAAEYSGISSDTKIVLYTLEHGIYELAYLFEGEDTVLVSCADGTILDAWTNTVTALTPAKGSGRNEDGATVEFNTALDDKDTQTTEDDEYIFYDSVRNIYYRDLNGANSTDIYWDTFVDMEQIEAMTDADNIWTGAAASSAITLQENLSSAYDYYLETLGLYSYDGNGSPIIGCVNDMYGDGRNAVSRWRYNAAVMAFGENINCHAEIDMVAHEYTHAVQNSISNVRYQGESGALKEAYADLGGELAQIHQTGTADWGNAFRNVKNPLGTNNPVKYRHYNWGYTGDTVDNGYVHNNSTVVSHAVYEMYQNGLHDVEELTELLFRTWHYLTYTATFTQYRHAMLCAAQDMGLSTEKVAVIKEAFDEADIKAENSYDDYWETKYPVEITVNDKNGAVKNAYIKVVSWDENWDEVIFEETQTDESGKCTVRIRAGEYAVYVYASGCAEGSENLIVERNSDNKLTIRLEADSDQPDEILCELGGTVRDAVTNEEVADVTMKFRKGYNVASGHAVKTVVTDENGSYYVEGLDYGYYTVELIKDGYITAYAVLQAAATNWSDAEREDALSQDLLISPLLLADDSIRVVLSWGSDPKDLDSHIVGTLSNGMDFHVYFADPNVYETDGSVAANLDRDDVDGEGPETVTLQWREDVEYRYYVHLFAGEGTISGSGAKIQVYSGTTLLQTISVPEGSDTMRYWNVFSFKNGQVKVNNTFTFN